MNKIIKKVLNKMGFYSMSQLVSDRLWHPLSLRGFGNTAKQKVTNDTALTVSTFYACIRNVSEDIAKLPLGLFRPDGEDRIAVTDHPLVNLIRYQPNPDMTAFSLREAMNAQMMGWGNAYMEIQRDAGGRPQYLWPLRPDKVTLFRTQIPMPPDNRLRLFYRVQTDRGQAVDIWAEDIIHLHGLGFNGVTGYNIVSYASQSLGTGRSMDKFSGAFFGNGLSPSGTLEHPNTLSQEAQDRLRNQMDAVHSGADQAFKTMVLEEGMKWATKSVDPKASQMVETRRFSVTEFCRWLRVPPHKVADLSRATFSNIEEQNIDYVQDALTGWGTRWEQALRWKLLSPAEQAAGYYFKHNYAAMLKGDVTRRSAFYREMWDRGILSINEIRALEELNPIDGGATHFVPMNFQPLAQATSPSAPAAVVADAAQRIVKHEAAARASLQKKHGSDFSEEQFIDHFKFKHIDYSRAVLAPLGVTCPPRIGAGVSEIVELINRSHP